MIGKVRLLCVFIALVLVVTGCSKVGTTPTETENKTTNTSEKVDEAEKKKIDLSGMSDDEAAKTIVQLLLDGKSEEYFNTTQSMETVDYQRIVVGE